MFVSVLVRRLRPGKTYEDFLHAWYPDKGFGFPVRGPIIGPSAPDDREILTLAFIDLATRDELQRALAPVGTQEATRHDRLEKIIESTTLRGVYEVAAEFDFSTDESVERGRPHRG